MIFLLLFYVLMVVILVRNIKLAPWIRAKLEIASTLAKQDIEAGKEWMWRYEEFDKQFNYPLMVVKFWRSFDSFITNDRFLK